MEVKPAAQEEHFSLNHIVWWILAFIVASAFSLLSWSFCYYLFNFPEVPSNFSTLQKLGRIGDIEEFTPLDSPPARSASPEYLYELFYSFEDHKMEDFNTILLRGYITNYEKVPVYRYLEGEFRISEVRQLKKNDFLYPGLLVKARSFVRAEKNDISSPFPLVIDYYIPTKTKNAQKNFQEGDLLELVKSRHCASIINVKKEGRKGDPTLKCVVVPLAYNIYITPDRQEIPLHPPSILNVDASLPENQLRPLQ